MSDMTPTLPYIENQILTYHKDQQLQRLMIGTSAWYLWLQTATTFTYISDQGSFTARREQAGNKRGGWYWRAYHQHAGRRRRVYLGGWIDVPVHRIDELPAGFETTGPAIFESATTTVLAREGECVTVTSHGWLDLRI